MKVQALFKFGKTAAKPAPTKKGAAAPKKGAVAPKKSSGSSKKGGWLGSNSNDINLDKW